MIAARLVHGKDHDPNPVQPPAAGSTGYARGDCQPGHQNLPGSGWSAVRLSVVLAHRHITDGGSYGVCCGKT
jgi:hypothetical protein